MMIAHAIVRWLARHAVLFAVIVAVLVVGAQLCPDPASQAGLRASLTAVSKTERDLRRQVAGLEGRSVTLLDAAKRNSVKAVDRRRAELARARMALVPPDQGTVAMIRNPGAQFSAKVRYEFGRERIDQEDHFLEELRKQLLDRDRALNLDAQIAGIDTNIRRLNAIIAKDEVFKQRVPDSRFSPGRYDKRTFEDLKAFYSKRIVENRAKRDRFVTTRRGLVAARRAIGQIKALQPPPFDTDTLNAKIAQLTSKATSLRGQLQPPAQRFAQRLDQRFGITQVMPKAALSLLAFILAPFAIRTLSYWALAPLAARRPAIRLLDTAVPIPVPPERSSVSRQVTLGNGRELLVRQGFVQSASLAGTKATQWLLDAHHPLSSIASGLYLLTRMRGDDDDTVTVSATDDPFAEVAILTLPAGAAAVLQPRAIAGVVQPIGSPLRISSHWRLGTLSAWLTGQLRFLVFHGPAEIILTGRRGVRIEAAVAGRSLAQAQLIGFSADIAYHVGRTETFVPYLIGREALLKDRIAPGSGIIIAEEALSGQGNGRGSRAIETGSGNLLDLFQPIFRLFGL